jgi:hypothetical protein
MGVTHGLIGSMFLLSRAHAGTPGLQAEVVA